MNEDDNVMWGFQDQFQASAESAAREIFAALDPLLAPRVFLVGILMAERADESPVCLVPADCGWAPECFDDVAAQAEHLEAEDDERQILQSHPVARQIHSRRLELRAFRNAIHAALDAPDAADRRSFCAWPKRIEDYMVCVVLQLKRDAIAAHDALTLDDTDAPNPLATSLIDAAVTEFLDGCSEALRKPYPGSDPDLLGRDAAEIVRAAGKRLMLTPAAAGEDGGAALFHGCNTISSLKIDGTHGVGAMLLARRGHPNVQVNLALRTPVPLGDFHAVRKLLGMAADGNSLLSDAACIYGFGQVYGQYDEREQDLFTVAFTDHYTWDLLHGGQPAKRLMHVSYGQPELPRRPIDKARFKRDLPRVFPDIDPRGIKTLWTVVTEAAALQRPTTLVVTAGAASEAARLERQGTRIEPVALTPAVLPMAAAIDGAMLVDPAVTCHAVGVVLDGLACEENDPARDAQYNAAVRYVAGREHCLAFVVSEDGATDLVPDLRPPIARSVVEEAVAALRALRSDPAPDARRLHEIMAWLSEYRFYLSAETCDEVNALRRQIETRLRETTPVHIVYEDLVPSEDLDDSYFLDE